MDKIKDALHGGHKKEGEGVHSGTTGYDQSTTTGGYGQSTTTGGGYGQPGYGQPAVEGEHEKKGLFGMGGHKKHGEGSSSSSSSDEEREGARERNLRRRERRAQRQGGAVGGAAGTPNVPLEGGEKKHGFFG